MLEKSLRFLKSAVARFLDLCYIVPERNNFPIS